MCDSFWGALQPLPHYWPLWTCLNHFLSLQNLPTKNKCQAIYSVVMLADFPRAFLIDRRKRCRFALIEHKSERIFRETTIYNDLNISFDIVNSALSEKTWKLKFASNRNIVRRFCLLIKLLMLISHFTNQIFGKHCNSISNIKKFKTNILIQNIIINE